MMPAAPAVYFHRLGTPQGSDTLVYEVTITRRMCLPQP